MRFNMCGRPPRHERNTADDRNHTRDLKHADVLAEHSHADDDQEQQTGRERCLHDDERRPTTREHLWSDAGDPEEKPQKPPRLPQQDTDQ
jgi:hypothetical protein